MITSRKRRNGRFALLFAVCLALIGYFSYHAVEGARGLNRRAALSEQIDRLAKYNQLLRIEEELDTMGIYAGRSILPGQSF